MELLLARHADPQLRDMAGETAIDVARGTGSQYILDLIEKVERLVRSGSCLVLFSSTCFCRDDVIKYAARFLASYSVASFGFHVLEVYNYADSRGLWTCQVRTEYWNACRFLSF